MPFTPPAVTLMFAAASALINLWLAARTVQARVRQKVLMGHGEPGSILYARGRSQANFIEYVPLALILMLVVELRVGPATWLWVLGSLLVLGRLAHPFGMERPSPNPLRAGGVLATWIATLGLAVWALYLAFTPAGGGVSYV